MVTSGVQFGTSGVRGLVVDMADKVCFAYVAAFLQYLMQNKLNGTDKRIGIAGDLRSSTPRIMNAVAAACKTMGFEPVNYGNIPSPAVALYGFKQLIPTVMVTGSHIPDDRNGIKFNTATGEILKPDEEGIRSQSVIIPKELFTEDGFLLQQDYLPDVDQSAKEHYIQRFLNFFPSQCLQDSHIGLYEHSSVSRDCLKQILESLGAKVTSLGRTDTFISVDTEAIRQEDIELAKQWSDNYHFDCIISTDGDGDRPLISDEQGRWLRGDVAGILCAKFLAADMVITPVSSNTAVEKLAYFSKVIRTKIGSPYVIEAMQEAAKQANRIVIGYEANGGFLQQTDISNGANTLSALPTRDAAIVPLTVILAAKQQNRTISELVNLLPKRYTYSDRIKDFPTERSQKIIANLMAGTIDANLENIKKMFGHCGNPISIDSTDGLRITLDSGDVIHLRASGNAPELRCYTESVSEDRTRELSNNCIEILKSTSC